MKSLEVDGTASTTEEVIPRVVAQFEQIASACNGLCSLGYGHGWPIRLGRSTSEECQPEDTSPEDDETSPRPPRQ